MQKYFDFDDQLIHLVADKSMVIRHSHFDVVQKLFFDNHYFNFLSCSKIKQAEFFEPNLKLYKTATFEEWAAYFKMDKKASKHIVANLLDFELTINSRVSHLVSRLMERDDLSNFHRNAIIQIISQTRNRKGVTFSKYKGHQTWLYVPKMTFGELKQLAFWLHDNRRDIYDQVVEGYSFLNKHGKKRLDELNRLRNNLFHLVPLSVYLTTGTQNYAYRKRAVKWVSKLGASQEMRKAVSEICGYADNYIEIESKIKQPT